MKLWEVIKALEENPEKVFKTDCGTFEAYTRSGYYYIDRFREGKKISSELGMGGFNGNHGVFEGCHDRTWQEVKQPVTWQEAIEAWAEGKKITCECEGVGTFFRPSNVSSACFTAKLITHGTWYIED